MSDTKRIKVTVTELEHTILKRCSLELGVSVSALVGALVYCLALNEADFEKFDPFDRDEVDELAIARAHLLREGDSLDSDLIEIGGDYVGRI